MADRDRLRHHRPVRPARPADAAEIAVWSRGHWIKDVLPFAEGASRFHRL
ncbi:hypothetical protein [Streptomyces alanosinicus]